MRDIRDPEDVYRQIIAKKHEWNIGVLQAADRVEQDRAERPSPATNGVGPTGESPPETPAQRGSER